MSNTTAHTTTLSSPFGDLILCATAHGLCAVAFAASSQDVWRHLHRHKIDTFTAGDSPILTAARAYLESYFAGERPALNFPLDLRGTAFQRTVWQALLTIPYGETRAYRDIALQIERPRAVRAVGQAVGANPVSIIVPCHRVVGRNGDLVGYGGGLRLKQALLALEKGLRELPLPTSAY